jgi:hypothetical protein
MWPAELSFLSSPVFKCPDLKCTRYYELRLGYFNLLPGYKGEREKIDPVGRTLKLCPLNVDAHSFLAIPMTVMVATGGIALTATETMTAPSIRSDS